MSAIRTILPAVVLTAALGVAAYVHATTTDTAAGTVAGHPWAGHHGHHGGFDGGFRHALGQLSLSADQKTQVESIYAQARPQLRSSRAASRATRELLASMAPTDPNYAATLATAKANAASHVQMESDVRSQIYAVLTPAQQAQIPGIIAAARSAREARKAAWQVQHAPSS